MIGSAGVAPVDRVVANDAAGRMVQRAENRIPGMRARVEARCQLLHLARIDHRRIDALQLVDLGPPMHGAERAVGVGQGEVASLAEHDVDVQVGGHRVVERERAVVEGDTFGRQIVRADDRRVATRSAAPEVALVEDGHIGDAVIGGEVVGAGQAVDAAADDDHVVGGLQLGIAPHAGPVLAGDALLRQRAGGEPLRSRIARASKFVHCGHRRSLENLI